jgi:hypothetical protein
MIELAHECYRNPGVYLSTMSGILPGLAGAQFDLEQIPPTQ